MNQWALWITGLTLCLASAGSLWLGLTAERDRSALAGCAAAFVLWYAGFFCFVGAS